MPIFAHVPIFAMVAPAPAGGLAPAVESDAFAMFTGWDFGTFTAFGFLLFVAVAVFVFGWRRYSRERSESKLRPRGRAAGDHRGRHFGAAWRAKVTRLEGRAPTPIATAPEDVVRIEATIVNASGSLGGDDDRACVWRNRAGARPDSAVGAEVIVIADDSGRCGVENLEHARVTAPTEKGGVHYEWTSLYVGDRVEILGTFAAERVGDASDDPAKVVYGTLGAKGPLEIRLLHRDERTTKPENTDP